MTKDEISKKFDGFISRELNILKNSFVGKNGCGKSTLAKLLIRLYDTDKGDIKINELKYSTCNDGYITDSGTHEYLIENNRTYKDLFKNEEAFG